MRRLTAVSAAAFVLALLWAPAASANPGTLTFDGDDAGHNCLIMGGTDNVTFNWQPFAGWFYKNIPAFELKPGDSFALDLSSPSMPGSVNEVAPQLEFQMGTYAGSTSTAVTAFGPKTKIVSNTQTASTPKGDLIRGNFELVFRVESPFRFAGGQLAIHASSPSPAYQADNTCSANQRTIPGADPSGFFAGRYLEDADGVPPLDDDSVDASVPFRLVFKRTCFGRPATIVGTQLSETLKGTPGPDVIYAGDGNDKVSGGKGKDLICGGNGKDKLSGGAGKDKLKGERGNDKLVGGKGKDKLKGGPGKDKVKP